MPPDRPITPAQVRAIHVALHALGIDDAAYRERLQHGWGVRSCKELTRRQASGLLASLGVRPAQPPGSRLTADRLRALSSPRPSTPPGVTRLPSPAQRRLLSELSREVDWREPDGYPLWLAGNMGLVRVATSDQAGRVIEGLKAIRRRQQRSADGPA